jgi:putative transposase
MTLPLRKRKSIRLKEYDYSSPGEYFVTICTHDQKCIFGDVINEEMHLSQEGIIARHYWMEIPEHFHNAVLDEFIIMPNHVHGIIILTEPVG